MHRCVASTFSKVFRSLEGNDILDPLNEVDLYCLYDVFLPRINKCLNEFSESWNHHALSSEGNMTPLLFFLKELHVLAILLLPQFHIQT